LLIGHLFLAGFPLAKFVARICCLISSLLELIRFLTIFFLF
jgi:hypothetical protein